MLITNHRTSKEVIDKVYADNGYSLSVNFSDMLEWIYECMELIGYPFQYIPKVNGINGLPALEITDYKAKLPCDFHKLRGILVNGQPAKYSSSIYHHLLSGECCDFNSSTGTGTDIIDNFGNEFSASLGTTSARNPTISFEINDNYLTLSQQEGNVCISYWAFPLSDDGYPLIPDNAKYRLALSKYLSKKIDWILFRKGEINRDIYEKSESDCNFYIGSISCALKIPDSIQMESLYNIAVRLRPIPPSNSYSPSREIKPKL